MLMFLPFLVIFAPIDHVPARALADFSRLSHALNQQISVVDSTLTEKNGLLVGYTQDSVTIRVGAVEETLSSANVRSADRLRDSSKDGAIKGALFGLGYVIAAQFTCCYSRATPRDWISIPAFYAAVGFGLDALNKNREPLYRASPPQLKVSLRF